MGVYEPGPFDIEDRLAHLEREFREESAHFIAANTVEAFRYHESLVDEILDEALRVKRMGAIVLGEN